MTRDEFFATLAPHAIQARLEGSPMFVSVRLAQNLLETGGVIHPWYNLGGIKAAGKPNEWWDGSAINKSTWEVYDGKRVDTSAYFRVYKSVYHFYKDQDLLFQTARYARVRLAQTPEEQADMLQACGYATDPQYAAKLKNIIFMYDLKRYDIQAEVEKRMLEELKTKIEQLAAENKQLKQRIEKLESRARMDAPEWAREAVDAAVAAGIVDTPEGGSYDFYRMLTVMHRKGLI